MEHQVCSLANLAVGAKGVVTGVQAGADARRRLLDLGLVSGTVVTSIRQSPLGDPTAFGIRGAVVALRRADGQTVWVRPVSD